MQRCENRRDQVLAGVGGVLQAGWCGGKGLEAQLGSGGK